MKRQVRSQRRHAVFDVLPAKAAATGLGRRIVYLDQNIVSDLAKLRLGRLRGGVRTDALRALANALQEAVFKRQAARCVESFFHHWESSNLLGSAGSDLFKEIWRFLVTHSWNLKLNGLEEVTRFQTLVSVAAQIGLMEFDRDYLWRGGFNDDPHESNEAAGVEVGGDLFVVGVQWEPTRVLQPGWALSVESARRRGRYATIDRAVVELCDEIRASVIKLNTWASWAIHWGRQYGRMTRADVDRFIASDSFTRLPAHDVLIALGARILSNRKRPLKDSDSSDMTILAQAIPYCDLVVTDNYMASLSQELHLDKKYGAKILPSKTEALLEAASWLAG